MHLYQPIGIEDAPATAPDTPGGRAADILAAATELFNRDGVAETSTTKIAKALGISSGNLHYHYHTKNDILVALYRSIERELHAAISIDVKQMTPEHAYRVQTRVFGVLWKFRFFFGSMDAYLTSSPVVFAEYTSFQKWLIARLVAILGQMTKGGHMKPVQPPNSPHMVAANTWMLWTGWVRWEMIERRNRAGSEEPDEIIVTRMIRQHFSFQEPYYDRGFARRLYGLIGRPQ